MWGTDEIAWQVLEDARVKCFSNSLREVNGLVTLVDTLFFFFLFFFRFIAIWLCGLLADTLLVAGQLMTPMCFDCHTGSNSRLSGDHSG